MGRTPAARLRGPLAQVSGLALGAVHSDAYLIYLYVCMYIYIYTHTYTLCYSMTIVNAQYIYIYIYIYTCINMCCV